MSGTSGGKATFTVDASVSDAGVMTYQWQKSANNTDWTNIAGATNASYTTDTLSISDNGMNYSCLVTNTKEFLLLVLVRLPIALINYPKPFGITIDFFR